MSLIEDAMPFTFWEQYLVTDNFIRICNAVPELETLANVKQSLPHQFDVYHHSWSVFIRARKLAMDGRFTYFDSCPYKNLDRYTLLSLAALLHDIGKTSTAGSKEVVNPVIGGTRTVLTFHGHDHVGADLAVPILTRIGLNGDEVEHVKRLIDLHLRPAFLLRDGKPTRHALGRLGRASEGMTHDLMILAAADAYGKAGEDSDMGVIHRYERELFHLEASSVMYR